MSNVYMEQINTFFFIKNENKVKYRNISKINTTLFKKLEEKSN
jgi:hypothetical protein